MKRVRRHSVQSALRLRETGECTDTAFRAAAYSALVPSSTFVDVSGVPQVTFRRFTTCGKYLVALHRNSRDLVLFRFESGGRRTWRVNGGDFESGARSPPRCVSNLVGPEEEDDTGFGFMANGIRLGEGGLLGTLPVPVGTMRVGEPEGGRVRERRSGCHFGRFFTEMYQVPVAEGNETLQRDFCLCTQRGGYLILASYCLREAERADESVGVGSVPELESFTLHLVEIETGIVRDRFRLLRDFVRLDEHAGVHMRGDALLVLSIREQVIHVIRVQEGVGRLVEEVRVGTWCRGDDEMIVASVREREAEYRRRRREGGVVKRRRLDGERGLGGGKLKEGFYSGLMQRLLAYVYRKHHGDGNERLFYRIVGQYSQLVMLKAQFLDEDHLLIRLGSAEQNRGDGGVLFFLVYCISSTRILNLFENRSAELLGIYEKYRDLFVGDAFVSATMAPARNLEEGGRVEGERNARTRLKRIRQELTALPVACQNRNVSVYLDRGLFSYNAERMMGLDGTQAVSLRDVRAVKFIDVRTGRLSFKLAPGVGERGRKRKALFLFHPTLPFVISMEFSLAAPALFNFHVYGFKAH